MLVLVRLFAITPLIYVMSLLHTVLKMQRHLLGSELGRVGVVFPCNLDHVLRFLSSWYISLWITLLFLCSYCLLLPL